MTGSLYECYVPCAMLKATKRPIRVEAGTRIGNALTCCMWLLNYARFWGVKHRGVSLSSFIDYYLRMLTSLPTSQPLLPKQAINCGT